MIAEVDDFVANDRRKERIERLAILVLEQLEIETARVSRLIAQIYDDDDAWRLRFET
jgi:hypothetical protein